MPERVWLDRIEHLSSTWKDRCDLVSPLTDRYKVSRMIYEAVWTFIEWDLKILRVCREDPRSWRVFDAHERLIIEGILRGFWVDECVTDARLEGLFAVDERKSIDSGRLVTRGNFPKVHKILFDLRSREVPYVNKRRESFTRLNKMFSATAHMSQHLILSPNVERPVFPEIKACLYDAGICAIRILRVSTDLDHVSIVESEFKEALRQLDSQI